MKLHRLYCQQCQSGDRPDDDGRHADDTICINHNRPPTLEEYVARHQDGDLA